MYENFAFEKRARAVTGYHFPCDNASYVMCLIHGIGEHAEDTNAWQRNWQRGIAVLSMDLRGARDFQRCTRRYCAAKKKF